MIHIRPEVAMYAAFARLNYKPWFALAEFIDNSIQSAMSNINALKRSSGKDYRLRVEVDIHDDWIEVRDNAAGISERDYARAFLPAAPPPDVSGLSEFGLGMKAAASWFARTWIVRSTALGEPVERSIVFEIPKIVNERIDYLEPIETPASSQQHYTTVTLRDLLVHPRGRTLGKIRDHLSSIYRLFIRDSLLELRLNDEALSFELPAILVTPYHATPNAEPIAWRKDLHIDLGEGRRVDGWAAILAKGSVTNAGFAVFRRRRLVQGSTGDAYRPEYIFGKPNKFIYQRLVGELEVRGFSVSHTKDGIQWDEWEEDILSQLRLQLDAVHIPLLDQSANHRVREPSNRDVAAEAAIDTAQLVAQHLPPIIDQQINAPVVDVPIDRVLESTDGEGYTHETVKIRLEHAHREWTVRIEIVFNAAMGAWYDLSDIEIDGNEGRVQIRLNLSHPFMTRFVSPDGDEIIPFTRLVAALAIAEITARQAGARQVGTLRINLNTILREALSGPIQRSERPNVR